MILFLCGTSPHPFGKLYIHLQIFLCALVIIVGQKRGECDGNILTEYELLINYMLVNASRDYVVDN